MRLEEMSDDEAAAFVDRQLPPYIEARITAGDPPDEARRIAHEQVARLFPDGRPGPGQRVLRVVDDDGTAVGRVWIGPHTPERPAAYWIWDIEIDEGQRGRGHGRAALLLAETAARAAGATEIGLNVFGGSAVARRLYLSVGYDETAITMRKAL